MIQFIKPYSHLLLLCFALLFLSGCSCMVNGYGYLVDSETNNAIDSVLAKSYTNKISADNFEGQMYSDSVGYFIGTTGLKQTGFNDCPNLIIELSKSGYVTKTVTNPDGERIKMIKE